MNLDLRRRSPWIIVVAIAFITLLDLPLGASDKPSGQIVTTAVNRVTVYDISTREDLLFAHLLSPLMKGDVAEWPILGNLGKQVGVWVDQFVSAQRVANIITEAFPLEGQPALRSIDQAVEQCAKTLGVSKPGIHIRNAPQAQAYVVHAFDQNHLIITSGLLNLYANRPEELKFVIGHELGHIKCDHLELKNKAFGLLVALQAINTAVIPDNYQAVLPTLGLGRLYCWCRESEISADRAGLLCCGEPKVAYQAIMRLQHGLNPDSPWIDPEKPDFDADKVIQDFQQWQNKPFVSMVSNLKRHMMSHPFIQERLAALKTWAVTGEYRKILERQDVAQPDQLIEVVKIQAFELAPEGQSIYPYVVVFDKSEKVFRTVTTARLRHAEWTGFKSTDKGVNQPRSLYDGQPLFFEIWDDGTFSDSLVGGFVVHPNGGDATVDESGARLAEYTSKIDWNWKERNATSRVGFARVTIRFSKRSSSQQD